MSTFCPDCGKVINNSNCKCGWKETVHAQGRGYVKQEMYPKKPINHGPASISQYPPAIQNQLKKIGMLPNPGESMHDYCMRCKDYTQGSKTLNGAI